MSIPYRIISWGGGTQSTAMAEMAMTGDLDPVDAILFCDNRFERSETYEIVEFYSERWRKMGAHVEILQVGDIRIEGAAEHNHIPFFTSDGGPLHRQCTRHFKIRPIKRRSRELIGFHPSKPPAPSPGSIESWIGFSWDEFYRMFESKPKFIINRFPLIENKINRWDSIDYLKKKRLPIPVASACICCPWRNASEWINMRENTPGDFQAAIDFDEVNRRKLVRLEAVTADELFIYNKGIPLKSADLEGDAAREKKASSPPLFVCNDSQCWT